VHGLKQGIALLGTAAAVALMGCGGGSGTSSEAESTPAVVISTDTPENGPAVLVDSDGRTLYRFGKDLKDGASACFGACAKAWLPVIDDEEPSVITGIQDNIRAVQGARTGQIGSIQRVDGSPQITYGGWPLYTLAGEHAGDADGVGATAFGGTWNSIRPDGSPGDKAAGGEEEQPFLAPAAGLTVGTPEGLGRVLLDAAHKTVYFFTKDRRGAGTSACYGACAQLWYSKPSGGTPHVDSGAKVSLAGSFVRTDRKPQATYNGWPLYTLIKEGTEKTKGVGKHQFGGTFYPLKPDGTKAPIGGLGSGEQGG
jgi:predicted lipoprotein with Yx(FWY)xxD motif